MPLASLHEEDLRFFTHYPGIHEVPRLSVPVLEETLESYLTGVRPLLSPEEFQATARHVQHFKAGDGPSLDAYLHYLAENTSTGWLESFPRWDYLQNRVPCPVHSNPFFVIHPTPHMSQLERASEIVSSSLRLWESIKGCTLPQETSHGEVQYMSSYWRVFGSTRMPMIGGDGLWTCPRSQHVVILHQNRFFTLRVYDNVGSALSAMAIAEGMREIIESDFESATTQETQEGGIGLLTCEDRDSWASIRSHLYSSSPTNQSSLLQVDSAIMIICFDSESPKSQNDLAQKMLSGTSGENRWFDKLQLIVCPDGSAAFNLEHTPHDGHTLLMCATYIVEDILGSKLIPGAGQKPLGGSKAIVTPLQWVVDEKILQSISQARKKMAALSQSTQSSVLNFQEFGSEAIKDLNLTPDAFVQMAFQIAFYRISGKVQSTSCNIKGLFHRAETIQSVSNESRLLCETFFKASSPSYEKEKLIRLASKRHSRTCANVKDGKGVERHLMCLKQIANFRQRTLSIYSPPEIFRDPAYAKFTGYVMSTSNHGGFAFDLFGFGPATDNGLGIGCIVKDTELLFNVTSFTEQAVLFTTALRETLLNMRSLCSSQISPKL